MSPEFSSAPRPDLHSELSHLRPFETAMRLRWERDEDGWRKLPPRAWPVKQPSEGDIPTLRGALRAAGCPPTPVVGMRDDCKRKHFDIATAEVFNNTIGATRGFEAYSTLASDGDLDGMTAKAVCLIEGMGGVEPDESLGVSILEQACAQGSAQAAYELGSIAYSGMCGVEENETAAYELFLKASKKGHIGGTYMVGDALLEGNGVERNEGKAVQLIYAAAEKGHRYARQRIRELLDRDAKQQR